MKPTKKLIQGTKAMIRLHQFLWYECGLQYADTLSTRDLRHLLSALEATDKD